MAVFNNYLTKVLKCSQLALVNIPLPETNRDWRNSKVKTGSISKEGLLLSVRGQEGLAIMEEVDDSRGYAQ